MIRFYIIGKRVERSLPKMIEKRRKEKMRDESNRKKEQNCFI